MGIFTQYSVITYMGKNLKEKIDICVAGLVAKSYPTLVTQCTVFHQALLSMGFPRQEYYSGLPFPSPGDIPSQGSNPCLLH